MAPGSSDKPCTWGAVVVIWQPFWMKQQRTTPTPHLRARGGGSHDEAAETHWSITICKCIEDKKSMSSSFQAAITLWTCLQRTCHLWHFLNSGINWDWFSPERVSCTTATDMSLAYGIWLVGGVETLPWIVVTHHMTWLYPYWSVCTRYWSVHP